MEKLFSVDELAAYLQVQSDTVREWCKSGKIDSFRLGRAYRVPESSVLAFLAKAKTKKRVTAEEWRKRNAAG